MNVKGIIICITITKLYWTFHFQSWHSLRAVKNNFRDNIFSQSQAKYLQTIICLLFYFCSTPIWYQPTGTLCLDLSRSYHPKLEDYLFIPRISDRTRRNWSHIGRVVLELSILINCCLEFLDQSTLDHLETAGISQLTHHRLTPYWPGCRRTCRPCRSWRPSWPRPPRTSRPAPDDPGCHWTRRCSGSGSWFLLSSLLSPRCPPGSQFFVGEISALVRGPPLHWAGTAASVPRYCVHRSVTLSCHHHTNQ